MTTELSPVRSFRVDEKVQSHAVAFSADGTRMAIMYGSFSTHEFANKVLVWDLEKWKAIKTLRGCSKVVDDVAFTPEGSVVCVGTTSGQFMGGEVNVWDCQTWKSKLKIEREDLQSLRSVTVSPDGKLLVTGTALSGAGGDKLHLWDLASGKCLRKFGELGDDVDSLDFAPDGKSIAAGVAGDRTASVWEIPSGKLKWKKRAHARVDDLEVHFSPNGKWLASCGDANVNVVAAASGKKQAILKQHGSDVRSIAFSPDSTRLVSASFKQLCLWEIPSGQLLAAADLPQLNLIGMHISADHEVLTAVHTINDVLEIQQFSLQDLSPAKAPAQAQEVRAAAPPKLSKEVKELLAAVLADPDNDEPRLAYAAWLEQQGNPRGEFIRVQCELQPLRAERKLPPKQRSLKTRLAKREQALLKQHFAEWTAPLAALSVNPETATFRRGFLAELRLEDVDVNDDSLAVLRHVPELELLNLQGSAVTDAGMMHLRRVKNLGTLGITETAVTPAGLAELKGVDRLVQVYNCDWGNRPIPEVEKWRAARNRRFLKLPPHEQRAEAIRALKLIVSYMRPDEQGRFNSISYSQSWASDSDLVYLQAIEEVEELDFFECNAVTAAGLKHLRPLKNLRRLRLSESGVTNVEPLKHLPNLTELNLDSQESLDPSSLRHLTGLKHLQVLTVRFCRLGDELLKHISQCSELRELDVIYNEFTADGLEQLRNLKKLEKLEFDYMETEYKQLRADILGPNLPQKKRGRK